MNTCETIQISSGIGLTTASLTVAAFGAFAAFTHRSFDAFVETALISGMSLSLALMLRIGISTNSVAKTIFNTFKESVALGLILQPSIVFTGLSQFIQNGRLGVLLGACASTFVGKPELILIAGMVGKIVENLLRNDNNPVSKYEVLTLLGSSAAAMVAATPSSVVFGATCGIGFYEMILVLDQYCQTKHPTDLNLLNSAKLISILATGILSCTELSRKNLVPGISLITFSAVLGGLGKKISRL